MRAIEDGARGVFSSTWKLSGQLMRSLLCVFCCLNWKREFLGIFGKLWICENFSVPSLSAVYLGFAEKFLLSWVREFSFFFSRLLQKCFSCKFLFGENFLEKAGEALSDPEMSNFYIFKISSLSRELCARFQWLSFLIFNSSLKRKFILWLWWGWSSSWEGQRGNWKIYRKFSVLRLKFFAWETHKTQREPVDWRKHISLFDFQLDSMTKIVQLVSIFLLFFILFL